MIPVKHIDPDDLALYAMQLLPHEEAAEMSLHLQHSAEARRVLAEFQGDLSLYALTAEMHSPSAQARKRLLTQVARERKAIPIDAPLGTYKAADLPTRPMLEDEPKRSVTAKVLPWVGWAVAAGLMVEAGMLYQEREHLKATVAGENAQLTRLTNDAAKASMLVEAVKDPSAVRVSLTSTGERPAPQGRATYQPDKGTLIFLASNLEPLQSYKTYELWLIPADGHDPIPAGTFVPDAKGYASVILPELPKGVQAKAFGVTIEDMGGSTTPTMPIILKGAAS